MGVFLLSSVLSFTFYQLAVLFFVSEDRRILRFGNSFINLTPNVATWLRRVFVVLSVSLGLSFAFWLHRPFTSLDESLGGVVVLGFFYGPLLAIWLNTLLAKPSDEALSTGQYIAGAGLALMFLVGSVGGPTGALIQGYARSINKISLGGAELSFVQKPSETRTLGGSLALSGASPTYASSSGAIGLEYLNSLTLMIDRDRMYLELFGKIEVRRAESDLSIVDPESARRAKGDIETKRNKITELLDALSKAKIFAEKTIRRPVACLNGWYTVTGDAQSINRHVAGLGDVFKRLPTIEAGQPLEELASEFVRQSFLIGADAVASVPTALLADKCDDLLEQFCPASFAQSSEGRLDDLGHMNSVKVRTRNQDMLMNCLGAFQSTMRSGGSVPIFDALQRDIQPDLANFVRSRGWQARPYFALGYASILSQLGQNPAASALLDDWIHTRNQRPSLVWTTAADWFDVRVRSILVNFLEDWLKQEKDQAPTALRNEHIANLGSLRAAVKAHLVEVDFFQVIASAPSKLLSEKSTDRFRFEDSMRDPSSCFSRDPDIESWRRLFETYVTADLSYLNALILHPNYDSQFSEEATKLAARLVSMDLSCMPRDSTGVDDVVHPRARTFYAQILDAFGKNTYLYLQVHKTSVTEQERQRSLSEAVRAVEFGLNMIGEVARKARDRNGSPFLKRIEGNSAVEAEENLKLTEQRLKKMKEDQQ